jgi:hypothetical protein
LAETKSKNQIDKIEKEAILSRIAPIYLEQPSNLDLYEVASRKYMEVLEKLGNPGIIKSAEQPGEPDLYAGGNLKCGEVSEDMSKPGLIKSTLFPNNIANNEGSERNILYTHSSHPPLSLYTHSSPPPFSFFDSQDDKDDIILSQT